MFIYDSIILTIGLLLLTSERIIHTIESYYSIVLYSKSTLNKK